MSEVQITSHNITGGAQDASDGAGPSFVGKESKSESPTTSSPKRPNENGLHVNNPEPSLDQTKSKLVDPDKPDSHKNNNRLGPKEPRMNSRKDKQENKGLGISSSDKEDVKKMNFIELNALRKNYVTDSEVMKQAEVEFVSRVQRFKDLNEGEAVNIVRHAYLDLVRNTDWDRLYVAISDLADQLEEKFASSIYGKNHPELRGIITAALNVERAQLLMEGMRRCGIDSHDRDWLKKHGFTQKDFIKFQELTKPTNLILDIERTSVNELAGMVGRDVQRSSSLTPDQMSSAVKRGTEQAFNIPPLEKERQAFRDKEYNMGSVPPVDSTTKFLLDADDKEIMLWNARAQLSRACAIKLSGGMNEIAANPEAKSLKNEQEQMLLSMPGVLEAISLEAHMIVNEAQIDIVLKNNGADLPKNIFKITEEKALDRFRQAKVDWLMNYRGLSEDEAKDAEMVSRNFIFLNDLVEDYDSIYDKDDEPTKVGHVYLPNTMPKIKSVPVWMTMHLQERLVAKIDGKSNWSAFGPFANKHPRMIDGLLPPNLFKSSLEISKDRNTVGGNESDERTLLEVFVENGRLLSLDPKAEVTMPAISHANAKEGRMGGYCAVTLSAAATVLNSLSKPSEIVNSKNWQPLGDALRDLGTETWYKQNIAIAILGVNMGLFATGFAPAMGWGKYGQYVLNEINKSDPKFFSRPKGQGLFDGVKRIFKRR